jgi:hypothetical protein
MSIVSGYPLHLPRRDDEYSDPSSSTGVSTGTKRPLRRLGSKPELCVIPHLRSERA